MLIVIFVFLVYIGIWYTYINNFMGVVENAMERFELNAYAEELQHKANLMCRGSGEMHSQFKSSVEINCNGGNTFDIGNIKKKIGCNVDCTQMNVSGVVITKKDGGVLISPAP